MGPHPMAIQYGYRYGLQTRARQAHGGVSHNTASKILIQFKASLCLLICKPEKKRGVGIEFLGKSGARPGSIQIQFTSHGDTNHVLFFTM